MNLLKNPEWIDQFLFPYERYEDIDDDVFVSVNHDLDRVQHAEPSVTVVIIAWNEEINVLRCVASLSKMVTTIPFEIVVVNNNSSDHTQDTIDRLHVRGFNESTQGAGPARQKGQENARGKYILTADADCLYPNCWVDEMIKVLKQDQVVCVYGRYSFIGSDEIPRWKLYMLEKLKDMMAEVRHFKQPYFNTFGISMGYVKELGLKIGFIRENRRGEDGQLCLDLMKYGRIRQVRSNKARAWTGARTLSKDGSFYNIIMSRIKVEFKRFKYNFIKRT
ncbi:glycosyltransferase involved in cell wall biogenesis [Pedobacter sp. BAL39]|uniref:glycosyltransferase family 2 protein n=1 Tax=Pedobacter sp. BAL39 TaxID=391596 RepID=UPI00015595C2|nr:glycosyltransferase family 2 protein [Pedobacter sp. BAL39]EDM38235.1 glycosyltransferase involved in cell wall biogenesis [Pedobacter sp. BAL39]